MLKNHENLLFLKNFDAWDSGIARERSVQIWGLCDKFEGLPQKKRLAGYFLIVTVYSNGMNNQKTQYRGIKLDFGDIWKIRKCNHILDP